MSGKSVVPTPGRLFGGELLGSALLVSTVLGSGVMAARLAAENAALALLANTLATAGALFALIAALGPVSGAHMNPLVSAAEVLTGRLSPRALPALWAGQLVGGLLGVVAAHAMFGLPLLGVATTARGGAGQVMSEAVATFALLIVIRGVADARPALLAPAVAAVIAAGYWATASTSFANPMTTLARALSDSYAGIRPADVPGFWAGQLIGAAAAVLVIRALWPRPAAS